MYINIFGLYTRKYSTSCNTRLAAAPDVPSLVPYLLKAKYQVWMVHRYTFTFFFINIE